jgi:hypothetical protein
VHFGPPGRKPLVRNDFVKLRNHSLCVADSVDIMVAETHGLHDFGQWETITWIEDLGRYRRFAALSRYASSDAGSLGFRADEVGAFLAKAAITVMVSRRGTQQSP